MMDPQNNNNNRVVRNLKGQKQRHNRELGNFNLRDSKKKPEKNKKDYINHKRLMDLICQDH